MKYTKEGFFKNLDNCYIIAELSANHNGDINKAIEIIRAAKDAGANCLKVQTYTPDTITINCDNEYFKINDGTWAGYNLYNLYQKAFTPWEWQEKLKNEVESLGMDFLATPFDKSSVDFLEKINIKMYKVSSFEIVDLPLIKYIASKGKPIFLSTGLASISEIEDAIHTIENENNFDYCLLKCSSSYPAKYEDMNLKTIQNMKDLFNCNVGLSDHSKGNVAAITAVSLGAKVVEKHLCIRRSDGGPDSSFSMEPDEFKIMVESIRICEDAIGSINYSLSESERQNLKFRKSIFAIKDICVGEVLTEENIRIIRPGNGLKPKYFESIVGRKTRNYIKRGTPIIWKDID